MVRKTGMNGSILWQSRWNGLALKGCGLNGFVFNAHFCFNGICGKVGTASPFDKIAPVENFIKFSGLTQRIEGFALKIWFDVKKTGPAVVCFYTQGIVGTRLHLRDIH